MRELLYALRGAHRREFLKSIWILAQWKDTQPTNIFFPLRRHSVAEKRYPRTPARQLRGGHSPAARGDRKAARFSQGRAHNHVHSRLSTLSLV